MSDIEKYKNDPDLTTFKDEEGNTYRIRVIGRGEHLFFQENDKALICQIDAVHAGIYSRSIKVWNENEKMNKAEKERVTELIMLYYKKAFNKDPVLTDSRL